MRKFMIKKSLMVAWDDVLAKNALEKNTSLYWLEVGKS